MNLLDMALGGDKPKKLPTRQPMWNQGYTTPPVSTATPTAYSTGVNFPNVKKEVVITPKPKDYGPGGNPYSPLPLDKEFGLRTAGGMIPGIGEGIDAYDLQNSVRQGDPLGAGLSLLSLALPFVGGLGKYGSKIKNAFSLDNIVPEMRAINFGNTLNTKNLSTNQLSAGLNDLSFEKDILTPYIEELFLKNDYFPNATFKRGSGVHLPNVEDIDFGGFKKPQAGFYSTDANNIDVALQYLYNKVVIPKEFEPYTNNIDGFVQSFKLNPDKIEQLKRVKYNSAEDPRRMSKKKRLDYLDKDILGVYEWGKNRDYAHPMKEMVTLHPDLINKNSYESFPVTKLPDGRVTRTVPWVDEGKYVAPALLSPLLLRALQGGNNDNTR